MTAKICAILGLTISLIGCQSAVNDMANNQFPQIKPQPIKSPIASTWTGSMGPYLATFKLEKDGNGLYCYSQAGGVAIQKVKISQGTIFIQDGTKVSFKQESGDSVLITSYYYGENAYPFIKDLSLEHASFECQKALQ